MDAVVDKMDVKVEYKRPAWLPGKTPQFLAASVVNLIAFAFGTAVGWPSVAGPQLQEAGYSEEALSWVAAGVWPAGLLGAAVFAPLTERCGRRVAALTVAVPLLAGWAALIQDWGLTVLLLGRGLSGVGMGGVLVVCPLYVGEVVEDSLRGQLGSYMPLFLNTGVLFVYTVGAQVSLSVLAVICGLFPAAFLVLFAWFPETPVFLLRQGSEHAAMKSLLWLRDPRQANVEHEMTTLRASVTPGSGKKQEDAATARDLVGTRGSRHALVITLGLLALQQFSGITAILNYAASIFQSAGSSLDPSAAASVVAAVQLIGSAGACVLVDRAGRRPLLFASCFGMAVTLFILGGCFFWTGVAPGWLPVICLSAYILVYALGVGPVPLVMIVEVFTPRLRSVASSIALAFLFALAFLVSKFFSQLQAALGAHGCFWLFGCCCVSGIFFTWLVVPETSGRSLAEVQDILERRPKHADVVEKKALEAEGIV